MISGGHRWVGTDGAAVCPDRTYCRRASNSGSAVRRAGNPTGGINRQIGVQPTNRHYGAWARTSGWKHPEFLQQSPATGPTPATVLRSAHFPFIFAINICNAPSPMFTGPSAMMRNLPFVRQNGRPHGFLCTRRVGIPLWIILYLLNAELMRQTLITLIRLTPGPRMRLRRLWACALFLFLEAVPIPFAWPQSPLAPPRNESEVYQQGVFFLKIREYDKARVLFEQSASAGNAAAMYNVGWFHATGTGGVEQDFQVARSWFEKGALGGDGLAMKTLGVFFEEGKGGSQDYEQARRWYENGAQAGNVEAMNQMGLLYAKGRGVTQSYLQALVWWKQAAEAGNPDSMANIGSLYLNGWGVAQDYSLAREWYAKGAAFGTAPGPINNLAMMYVQGQGGPKDYKEGRRLLEQAAAAGSAPALNNLGKIFENGWGVPRNLKTAREWYAQGAEAGDSNAMASLGRFYEHGAGGLKQDNAQALTWYQKSANAGNSDGQTLLMMLKNKL